MKMYNLIQCSYRESLYTVDKLIEDAFQKHFSVSIHDVDLREIEHIVVEGDPIESFIYRGETFLYIHTDINRDQEGVYFTIKFSEV